MVSHAVAVQAFSQVAPQIQTANRILSDRYTPSGIFAHSANTYASTYRNPDPLA